MGKIAGYILLFILVTISCQDSSSEEDNSETLTTASSLTELLHNVAVNEVTDGCVSLIYPITIFSYNSSFLVENTQVINSDLELLALLNDLDNNEYYSIDFPVTLAINGQNVTLSNNQQLEIAVNAALLSCNVSECDNPGVLTDNLLFYIPFSSGVVIDLKGGMVSAPTDLAFGADRDGNASCAAIFNGNQYLHIPANATNALVNGSGFSISVWFKMQNTAEGNIEYLFRKGDLDWQGFFLTVYDMNTPMFGIPSAEVWDVDWNQDETLWNDTTNWHHLVATLDANNTLKLYRDGELRGTLEAPNSNIGDEGADYFIGEGFIGMMDDLRVYRTVLTPAEVQTLFELDGDCSTCLE